MNTGIVLLGLAGTAVRRSWPWMDRPTQAVIAVLCLLHVQHTARPLVHCCVDVGGDGCRATVTRQHHATVKSMAKEWRDLNQTMWRTRLYTVFSRI